MSSFRSITITSAAMLGYCEMVSFAPQIFFRDAVSADVQTHFAEAVPNADSSLTTVQEAPAVCAECLHAASR